MHSPVAELLSDLAAALDTAGVPWFLFGAQAAILHGAARLTADVDVTVRLPVSMSAPALATTVEQHRFARRFSDPRFTAQTRVLPFAHVPTDLPLDIVLAGPGLEDQFFARAEVREIDGVAIRVASAEDIIVMKVLAGRPKDQDDVVAVLKAYGGGLDRAYVGATLNALQEALAQNDLLPLFQEAIARASRR